MELKELERNLSSRLGRVKGLDDWLLDKDESTELIEMARKCQVLVLGIEGFHQESGKMISDLSLIADFSATLAEPVDWHLRVEKSCRDALVFVESAGAASIRFKFVLASQTAD